MGKSNARIEELRTRLSALLSDWETEISAVIGVLEKETALADQTNEVAELRERVRERDLALDYVKKKSKEKDQRLARLEQEHERARARVEELEQKLAALDAASLEDNRQEEFEALRAELAARKSLVKSLRVDAERGKTLEREISENRNVIATMQESIDRYTRMVTELRKSTDQWERRYRGLTDAKDRGESHGVQFPPDTAAATLADERMPDDGTGTIVIDMTEPLRKAHDARRRKSEKA